MKGEELSKIFSRQSQVTLKDEQILELYHKVLLFCESKDFDKLNGKHIGAKEFKGYLAPFGIDLVYNHNPKTNKSDLFKVKRSYYVNYSACSLSISGNRVYFTVSGNKLKALLKHIRNAFAHNLIVADGDDYYIADFVSKKHLPDFARPTMLGKISKDAFQYLIEAIIKMKS